MPEWVGWRRLFLISAAGFGPAFWTVIVMSAAAAAAQLLLPGRTRS